MNRIKIPSDRYIMRSSGILTPMTDIEKREQYYCQNYDMIAHYSPIQKDGKHGIYVEDCEVGQDGLSKPKILPESEAVKMAQSNEVAPAPGDILIDSRKMKKKISPEKVCRFCKKTNPDVKFKKIAHALSELIGNKSIFLREECDVCNEFFGRVYEDALSNFLGAARTVAQTAGKGGPPSYKDEEGTIRIDIGTKRTVIQAASGGHNIDWYDDHIDLHLQKVQYSPLAAFKCLVVMALSIMPYHELKAFDETIEWILEEEQGKGRYDFSYCASQVIEKFLEGAKPLSVQAWLFRRKSGIVSQRSVYDVPYCQFILEFDNFSFQIIVPSLQKDAVLWKRKINVPQFPASFEVISELGNGRKSTCKLRDMSNPEKISEPIEISLHFEKKIEETENLGTVEEMAKREGVKPLRPKKDIT